MLGLKQRSFHPLPVFRIPPETGVSLSSPVTSAFGMEACLVAGSTLLQYSFTSCSCARSLGPFSFLTTALNLSQVLEFISVSPVLVSGTS